MADILKLAEKVGEIKENIRKNIVDLGVKCDTSVPFNQYPAKIKSVEAELNTVRPSIWVENKVGTVKKGDRVLLKNKTQGTEELFSDTVSSHYDKKNANSFLIPTNAGIHVLRCGYNNDPYLMTYDEGAKTTTSNQLRSTHLPENFVCRVMNKNLIAIDHNSSTFQELIVKDDGSFELIDAPSNCISFNDKYLFNFENRYLRKLEVTNSSINIATIIEDTNGVLSPHYSYETTGIFNDKISKLLTVYSLYSTCTGFADIDMDNGIFTQFRTKDFQSIIDTQKRSERIYGCTNDFKYAFVGARYTYNYDREISKIVKIDWDNEGISVLEEFTNLGQIIWYPTLNILTCNKNGVIRLIKYDEDKDSFYDITPTGIDKAPAYKPSSSASTSQVSLSFDGSKMLFGTTSDTDVCYNLGSTEVGYKAVPDTPQSYSNTTHIGYCTGEVDGDNIKVYTALPLKDDVLARDYLIRKPAVVAIDIPEN